MSGVGSQMSDVRCPMSGATLPGRADRTIEKDLTYKFEQPTGDDIIRVQSGHATLYTRKYS